jgi:hypothetical protein
MCAAVAIILAITIWRGIALPRRAPRQPACERCRYPIGGVGSLTCPECGADLREEGITTPLMEFRRRTPLVITLLAWTVLAAMFSLYAWDQASYRLRVRAARSPTPMRMLIISSAHMRPASAAYTETGLNVSAEPIKGGGGAVLRELWLTLRPLNAAEARMTISGGPGDFRCAPLDSRFNPLPKGRAADKSALSGQIVRWWTACGVKTTEQVQAEADELAAMVEGAMLHPDTMPTHSGKAFVWGSLSQRNSSIPGPPPTTWVTKAFLAIGATLWASGGLAIVLRRRRLVARLPPVGQSPLREPALAEGVSTTTA